MLWDHHKKLILGGPHITPSTGCPARCVYFIYFIISVALQHDSTLEDRSALRTQPLIEAFNLIPPPLLVDVPLT